MSTTPDEASERRARAAASRRAPGHPGDDEDLHQTRLQRLLMGVGSVALLGAMVAAAVIYSGGGGTVGQHTPPAQVTATARGVAIGKSSAPVHVVVYEEFGSAASVRFEMGSRDYLRTDAGAGRVYVEYRPVASTGGSASRALNAFAVVLHSAGPKAAWRFHDLLFQQQATSPGAVPTAAQLVTLAVRAGATRADVGGPISSGQQQAWAERATTAASKAGVQQLPDVLVDGKPLRGPVGEVLDRLETTIARQGR
jgi:protein-disulfide isomerase